MLAITGCEKKYNQQLILRVPDIRIGKGIFWLQGANGSGKTTFLRMVAGMIPFSGDIFYDGISLKQKPKFYRRHISYAEAEPLYPTFISGNELLEFYREVRKDVSSDSDHLADLFRMKSYLAAPLGSYSSGMTKKLSLLLALIGRPQLVLLDEPLATLDGEATHQLPELISHYHRQHGCNFIFSSHQPVDEQAFAIDGRITVAAQTLQINA